VAAFDRLVKKQQRRVMESVDWVHEVPGHFAHRPLLGGIKSHELQGFSNDEQGSLKHCKHFTELNAG